MRDKVLEELQFSVGIVLGREEVVPRGIVKLDRETEEAVQRAFGTGGELEARRG